LSKPAAVVATGERAYGRWALACIAALTLARLAWIAAEPAGLYPDEAQYWVWAKHLALGYYSKPPLVAWLIALTTALFGDREWAIRLPAPLLHAIAAGFVYGIGARLYDRRTGFWAALGYATLPGVSLSSFVISTDAALLPCWAAALYAFIRAREESGWRWWLLAGTAAGFGLLAKYAMVYWLLAAFGFVLLIPTERRHVRALLAATGIGLLILLPNLWWNWQNGFVSFLAVRNNAHLTGNFVHPRSLIEFFGAQFGVMGPLFFAMLVALALRPVALAEPRARLLVFFSLPILALLLAQSLVSHAEPNWAAPAYVAAIVLVVAAALRIGRRRWVVAAIALDLAAAAALFGMTDALAAVGLAVPAKYDPLHRLRGWRGLGERVGELLAAHPGLTLLADDRETLAALTYYVHPHPFGAVEWSPVPGIGDEWRLTNDIGDHRGADFLAVTVHDNVIEMRPDFAALTPLTTITTRSGTNGGTTYHIYIARDFRGSGRRHR
jgi:4-amino-4-deoxy-L-arabinose transferase-like glycosyltransferase